MYEQPDDETEHLPDRGDQEQEQEGDTDAAVDRGPAECGDHPRYEVDGDRQAGEHTRPREDASDEPEAPATPGGAQRRRDDRDVECVHSPPGVGGGSSARRRATVRNPVCATMR